MSKVKSVDQIDILETNHPDEQNRFEQTTNVGGTKSKISSKKRTSRSASSDRESDLESLRSVDAREYRRSRRMSRSRSRSRDSRSRSLARPLSAVRPLSGAEESENDENRAEDDLLVPSPTFKLCQRSQFRRNTDFSQASQDLKKFLAERESKRRDSDQEILDIGLSGDITSSYK